jgi:hypothetical protein
LTSKKYFVVNKLTKKEMRERGKCSQPKMSQKGIL